LFGPVLGGVASVAGTGWTFGAVAIASMGVAAWALATPAAPPEEPQPLSTLFAAVRDRRILLSVWLVVLPALLFRTLRVLGARGPFACPAWGWARSGSAPSG